REWLGGSAAPQVPWNNLLVVLQPCGPVSDEAWATLRQQILRLRLAGLILPERVAGPDVAAQQMLQFADEFLTQGKPAGAASRDVGNRLGTAGLNFASCFPPGLRVTVGDETEDETAAVEEWPLPDEPYHPLVPLDREERALLVGRDNDIGGF